MKFFIKLGTAGDTPETPETPETLGTPPTENAPLHRGAATEIEEIHQYIYAGGKLLRETITEGETTRTLDFVYDNAGNPYSLIYNNGTTTTTYYYITNLQGDVMYLVDSSGNEVAAYDYDPYGKVITATGAMAEINPLRYRGYYYDSETGFYYLQSRYYDPEICRFINADSYASTGQGVAGCNMFAYCLNNPINRIDTCGFSSFGLFSGIAAMFFGFGFAVSLGTVVTDDYIAIQINYVYSGSMKNNDVQQLGLSMGPTLTLQITDKERLADLEGESTAIGGGGSVGAEVLVDDKGTPFGWQASGGTDGYSKDFHKIKSNTVTIIKIPTINLPRRGKKWWQDTHDSGKTLRIEPIEKGRNRRVEK